MAQKAGAGAARVVTPSALDLSASSLPFSLTSGPPSSVRLDGLALTKLVKHSRDSHPHTATGLLLGLDLDGALEVTNLFGLPRNSLRTDDPEGDIRGAAANQSPAPTASKHITTALSLLSSVNADANLVGIYMSSFLGLGSRFTQQALETLKVVGKLMDKEGSTGKNGDVLERAIVLVHDLAQSAQGNTVVKAYRLSAEFVVSLKANDFTAKGCVPSRVHTRRTIADTLGPCLMHRLIDHRITFSSMFHELPLSLHNTALLDALISTLSTPQAPLESILPPSSFSLLSQPPRAPIDTSYSNLTLAHTPVLSSALEQTLEQVDEYLSEAGNVGFQSRQLAREKTRLEAAIARRKVENATRTAQGLQPLPAAEEERRLEKLLKSEPNRLETTLMLGALDAKARRAAEESAAACIRLEGARAGTL